MPWICVLMQLCIFWRGQCSEKGFCSLLTQRTGYPESWWLDQGSSANVKSGWLQITLICMSCMWDACFTIHASASKLQNPDWGKRPHVKCLSFTCCQVEGHWDNPSQSKGLWGSLVTHHYSDLPQRAEGLLQLIKLLFILLSAWLLPEFSPSPSSTRRHTTEYV